MENDPLPLAEELGSQIGKEAAPKLLEIVREHLLTTAQKPGNQTSEFQLTAIGLVASLILVSFGAYNADEEMQGRGIELAKWCIVGYAASRGAAKIAAKKDV